MKKVSIISVNYDQAEITANFLRSISRSVSYPNYEVILVDNGSKVDHTPKWRLEFPGYNIIRSEENLGFAGGNNLAIRYATGEFYFLVNNDTVFKPLLIEKLAATLEENPQIGVVSPKILYHESPDIIQYAGFTRMNYFTGRNKCVGKGEKDVGQYDHAAGLTGYIHGAAVMTTKDTITKAGKMPEKYFLYYEEMDWCEQIRANGLLIAFQPDASILHMESVSTGRNSYQKEYYMTRNRILFIRRNADEFSRIVFSFYFAIMVFPRNLTRFILKGRFDLVKATMAAIAWNFRNKSD